MCVFSLSLSLGLSVRARVRACVCVCVCACVCRYADSYVYDCVLVTGSVFEMSYHGNVLFVVFI